MKNSIVILILAAVIGLAVYYIVRQKKNGAKCIGCPYSKECGKSFADGCCSEQNKS